MGGGGFPSCITLCAELQAGPLLSPHAQRVLSAECGRRDMWHVPYAPLPHVTAILGGSAQGSRGPSYLVVIHDGVEGLDPHGVYVPVQDDPLGAVVRDVGQVPHDGGEEACGRWGSVRSSSGWLSLGPQGLRPSSPPLGQHWPLSQRWPVPYFRGTAEALRQEGTWLVSCPSPDPEDPPL